MHMTMISLKQANFVILYTTILIIIFTCSTNQVKQLTWEDDEIENEINEQKRYKKDKNG